MARAAFLKYLGWEEVRRQLKLRQVDPTCEALLSLNLEGAHKALPDAVRQAYCIVVTVDERNQIQAYRIQASQGHQAYDYFSGQHVVQVQKQGYEEPVTIPKVGQAVVDGAIQEAVKRGLLWLVSGPASIYAEVIPAGLLIPGCELLPPPARLSTMDVLPQRLPEAWKSEITSALAISVALSSKYGKPMPWRMVREALDGAFQAHYLERTVDSKPWPCDYGDAQWIKVRVPKGVPSPPPPPPPDGEWVAEADLQPSQIQDLAETMGDLLKAAAGIEIKFHLRVELDKNASQQVKQNMNAILEKIALALSFEKYR